MKHRTILFTRVGASSRVHGVNQVKDIFLDMDIGGLARNDYHPHDTDFFLFRTDDDQPSYILSCSDHATAQDMHHFFESIML